MLRSQLGGWACQARPLRLFPAAELLVLESTVEVLVVLEHLVDDTSDLERHESTGDSDRLSSDLCFVEGEAPTGDEPHTESGDQRHPAREASPIWPLRWLKSISRLHP